MVLSLINISISNTTGHNKPLQILNSTVSLCEVGYQAQKVFRFPKKKKVLRKIIIFLIPIFISEVTQKTSLK